MDTKKISLAATTGEQAKVLRSQLRLSQTKFWGALGVSQPQGSRYEGGTAIPEPVQILLTVGYGTEEQCRAVVGALRRSEG